MNLSLTITHRLIIAYRGEGSAYVALSQPVYN